MVDLSVVIVTYHSAGHLRALASTLEPALRGLTATIIVVDNAANATGDAALAHELWPTARLITNAVNRGFGAAVNQALALAQGRAVLIINPDTLLPIGLVSQLLDHLDRHPAVGIAAPRLADAAGQPVLSAYPFLTPATVAWRHFQVNRLWPGQVGGRYRSATLAPPTATAINVDWVQGACLLLRRSMLDEIGGFDERFFLYAEEVDLMRRAHLANWQTHLLTWLVVRHREGSSSEQVVPLKLASHYFSTQLYFEKHHPGRQAGLVRLILLFDLALRCLYRLIGVARGRPPDALIRLRTYLLIARTLATGDATAIERRWRAVVASTGS